MAESWEEYEKAARVALQALSEELGLSTVEMKQVLVGKSGTDWEVDAKAWCKDSEKFLVVEARRYRNSRLNQEQIASVAFRVEDVGAKGGVVVSPLPLQSGAAMVAASANIEHVRLTSESTPELYLAEYMGKRYHGVTVTESIRMRATPLDSYLGPPKEDT